MFKYHGLCRISPEKGRRYVRTVNCKRRLMKLGLITRVIALILNYIRKDRRGGVSRVGFFFLVRYFPPSPAIKPGQMLTKEYFKGVNIIRARRRSEAATK